MQRYEKLLINLGFKVKVHPFKLFPAPMISEEHENLKRHGDSFYSYKHEYLDHDLIVTNIMNRVCLILLNPVLIK